MVNFLIKVITGTHGFWEFSDMDGFRILKSLTYFKVITGGYLRSTPTIKSNRNLLLDLSDLSELLVVKKLEWSTEQRPSLVEQGPPLASGPVKSGNN